MNEPPSLSSFCVNEVLKCVECIREMSMLNLHPSVFNYIMKIYWLIEMGKMPHHRNFRSLNCYCAPPIQFDGFDDWMEKINSEYGVIKNPCDMDNWIL
jgi:hypothetical protein